VNAERPALGSVRNGVSSYFTVFILIASVLFGLRGLITTVSISSAIIFGLIPDEVLDAATEAIRDSAATKGIAIEHRIAAGLPATFFGEPHRIAHVLEILMDNAVKF
jgi:signal transduction histidine kinase